MPVFYSSEVFMYTLSLLVTDALFLVMAEPCSIMQSMCF